MWSTGAMRAWRVHQPGEPADVLRLEDIVADPVPGPGEALIRVEATAVNFADILLCRGSYQVRPPHPFTPGLETCGIVEALGPGVVDLPVGARVAGLSALPSGGYAERALVRAGAAVVMPDDVPAADATVLYTTYQTSHVALHHRARLQAGEWLLVHAAASGVGAAALQLGLAAGARVIATAGGPDKVAGCLAAGAHHAIDYTAADLYAEVMAITGGHGVDVAYDPVGGDAGDVTRRLMAWEGRLLVIGFASGTVPSYPGNHVLVKNYSIVGVHWGAYADHEGGRAVIEAAQDDLVRLYRSGAVHPDVTDTLPLEAVPEALARVGGRRSRGRLVIAP